MVRKPSIAFFFTINSCETTASAKSRDKLTLVDAVKLNYARLQGSYVQYVHSFVI